jgi:MATE family multidrug resistance protein
MLEAAFVGVTALGSRMGEVVLAANAVLLNFQTLAAFGLDGFAHAAEALVGKGVGARDERSVRAAVRTSGRLALALSLAMALVFLIFGHGLIALMTDLPEIRAAAATYLPYLVLSPPVSVWAFLFDGVFIGATRTELLRNAMALCLVVFAVAVALLVPAFGNHGLWLAFLLFMVARGLTLGLAYLAIERKGGLSAAPAGTA